MGESVQLHLDVTGVALGWVVAEGCSAGPSPTGLLEEVRVVAQGAVTGRDSSRSVALKTAVRNLLRSGGDP